MKKIISMTIIILMILMSVTSVFYAADTISVNASVNNTSKVVTIEGNIASGSGQQVTVLVVNSSGGTDYVDQTTSGANGSYQFTYKLDESIAGEYKVTVGGTEIISPVSATFTFVPADNDDDDDDDDDNDGGRSNGNNITGSTPTPIPADTPVEIKVNRPVLNSQTGEAVASVTGNEIAQAFASATVDSNGIKTVILNIPVIEGAEAYVLQVPANTLGSGSSTDVIQIVTKIGTIIVPSNMLSRNDVDGNQNIDIVIVRSNASELDEAVKTGIGDRPVLEIFLRSNEAAIPWSNLHTPVRVSVPYTPAESEDIEKITVWYIAGNGEAVPMYDGRYNSSTGMVTFTTTHFSKFAVAYLDIEFEDLKGYGWAKRQIEVLASKGIINGTSDSSYTFNPAANITRADYITFLVKTLGLTAEVDSNFADVEEGKYYYEMVGIAKELGIANGKGSNMFDPETNITRQDMIAMTERALKIVNKLKAEGIDSDLDKFADVSQADSYAVESIANLVKDGLIVGSNNKLKPTENTTRAEAAVLMYRIYNKE